MLYALQSMLEANMYMNFIGQEIEYCHKFQPPLLFRHL